MTKVGALRDAEGGWPKALARASSDEAVHDNLRTWGSTPSTSSTSGSAGSQEPEPGSIAEPFGVLADLRREGLIRHLGVSTVSAEQVAEAQAIAPVVCVQNFYNLANRGDDDARRRAGGARTSRTCRTSRSAGSRRCSPPSSRRSPPRTAASPMAVALAWLLHRSPNILLIPGTSSVEHLHENVAGAALTLSDEDLSVLDGVASAG